MRLPLVFVDSALQIKNQADFRIRERWFSRAGSACFCQNLHFQFAQEGCPNGPTRKGNLRDWDSMFCWDQDYRRSFQYPLRLKTDSSRAVHIVSSPLELIQIAPPMKEMTSSRAIPQAIAGVQCLASAMQPLKIATRLKARPESWPE